MTAQHTSLQRSSSLFAIQATADLLRAIHALEQIKDRAYANLTPEQVAMRQQILGVALQLLESEVNNSMNSCIFTWTGGHSGKSSA